MERGENPLLSRSRKENESRIATVIKMTGRPVSRQLKAGRHLIPKTSEKGEKNV